MATGDRRRRQRVCENFWKGNRVSSIKLLFSIALFALHVAVANGQIEIVSMLLERYVNHDLLNWVKQTPLMLAAMHGKISCVEKLIEAGANILMFDSTHRRTCMHYAAYYGHSDCLQAILSAAITFHVSASWGYARFVNIRDGKGATPLHLAARQKRSGCVHILLDNGALSGAHSSIQTNEYRIWQEVPILVIISMLAYFCFLEQLLVGKMSTGAIAISLPFSCVMGLLASMTASTMVKRRYVWGFGIFRSGSSILVELSRWKKRLNADLGHQNASYPMSRQTDH